MYLKHALKIRSLEISKNFFNSDHRRYGRCFTATPPPVLKLYGIKKIRLVLWQHVRIFFHTPGIFATGLQPTFVNIEKGRQNEIDVRHEEFKMLEYRGQYCIQNTTFNRDKCTQELFEKRLSKEVIRNALNIFKP